MNLLNISMDELQENLKTKVEAWEVAVAEMNEAHKLIDEKNRLEALKASFGEISDADIAAIKESMTLQPASIVSEEKVKVDG